MRNNSVQRQIEASAAAANDVHMQYMKHTCTYQVYTLTALHVRRKQSIKLLIVAYYIQTRMLLNSRNDLNSG